MYAFLNLMSDADVERCYRVEEWRGEEHEPIAIGVAEAGEEWVRMAIDHESGLLRIRGFAAEEQARVDAEESTSADLYCGLTVAAVRRASELRQEE